VKVFNKSDNAGPAAMFLVVLEGMVYTVGAIFAAAALYLGTQCKCWCHIIC
jgi:predicted membrane channel-forming protein YqfA (hemolysin III family)